MPLYKHKFYEKQSECVKYRGNTDQIDVTDTILAILAKYPGSTWKQIADKIFPKELSLSRGYVSKRLRELTSNINENDDVAALVTDGKFYYLWNDAWSHDIGKTKSLMERLNKVGVSPEQATFLSSGLLMHSEEVLAESLNRNFNINESAAAAPFVYKKPEDEREVIQETSPAIEEAKESLEKEIELMNVNPFENISSEERSNLRTEVITDIRNTRLAEEKAAEEKIQQEIKDREAKAISDEKARKDVEYKNVLKSIKTAKDLLGKEVQINPPKVGEDGKEVIGTILEIKTDSVDFLILYSNDPDTLEGTVKNYTYESGLTYKILV